MAEGDGRIGLPELLVGVPFPTAALEVVRFAVPREKLQSLIYTRRSLSARDALMRSPFHHIETTGTERRSGPERRGHRYFGRLQTTASIHYRDRK
jgi:enoyl-CoA hydratase/carnithine racemase